MFDDRELGLIVETNRLFPIIFDQSRWVFCFDVDLALREVEWRIHGWGGRHPELITSAERLNVPAEGWSEAFYAGASHLWSLLEVQLEPHHH